MGDAEGRVHVDVYDPDFSWAGQLSVIGSLTATQRTWERSTATFATDPDSDLRDALMADGALAAVVVDGEQFVAGWLDSDGGSVDPAAPLEYGLLGVETVLWDTSGWPKPDAGVTGQDVEYWRMRGPAETVVKAALQQNAQRLGLPLIIAPDQGRGAVIEVSLRYHPLIDRMQAQLATSGLRPVVTILEGQGVGFDVAETTTHTVPMGAADGVITGGTWTRHRPTVTRAIAGSQGEGTDRAMWGPHSAPWEASSARRIETFVDARDVGDGAEGGSPEDTVADRLRVAVTEGEATYDLALELDSTDEFAYATHWRPGDVVPLQPRHDVEIVTRLDAAELSITDGIRIRPVIGAGDDPLAAAFMPVTNAVIRLARAARDQQLR